MNRTNLCEESMSDGVKLPTLSPKYSKSSGGQQRCPIGQDFGRQNGQKLWHCATASVNENVYLNPLY